MGYLKDLHGMTMLGKTPDGTENAGGMAKDRAGP